MAEKEKEESGLMSKFAKMVSDRRKKAIKSKKMDEADSERSKSNTYQQLTPEERRERMEGIMERKAEREKSAERTKKQKTRNDKARWVRD